MGNLRLECALCGQAGPKEERGKDRLVLSSPIRWTMSPSKSELNARGRERGQEC